jgi:hypothetical protein
MINKDKIKQKDLPSFQDATYIDDCVVVEEKLKLTSSSTKFMCHPLPLPTLPLASDPFDATPRSPLASLYPNGRSGKDAFVKEVNVRRLFSPHEPWPGLVSNTEDSAACYTSQKPFEIKVSSLFSPLISANGHPDKAVFSNRFEHLLGLSRNVLVNRPKKETGPFGFSNATAPQEKFASLTKKPFGTPELLRLPDSKNVCFEQHVSSAPSLEIRGNRF